MLGKRILLIGAHADDVEFAVAAARKISNFLMFKPTYPSGRPPWRLLNGLPRVSGRTEPSGRKPSDSR
jgi:hypothetical protein